MKTQINIKSILVYTICVAGTMFFASSCSENKTTDSMEVAEEENVSRLTNDDETIVVIDNDNGVKFLMAAAEMQLEEINLGKLAQQKGTTPHVKELGKMMEVDHTKTLAELNTLAQSKSVAIPATATEDSMETQKDLMEKEGNDFGKAYSDMMVEHHEDAIELFEKAATDSEDAEIKAWAAEKLPTMRTHLEHAKACKAECDKL
jgi:putative membrane protein